jgi:hypothetical protein
MAWFDWGLGTGELGAPSGDKGQWGLGTGDWGLGTLYVSVRYDGNTFFVFDQILSPSNAPYGLGTGNWGININLSIPDTRYPIPDTRYPIPNPQSLSIYRTHNYVNATENDNNICYFHSSEEFWENLQVVEICGANFPPPREGAIIAH